MRYFFVLFLLFPSQILFAQILTPFEKDSQQTATYSEIIAFYQQLDKISPYIQLQESGTTDIGKPLHTVVLSTSKIFTAEKARAQGKTVLFINNGIHPGEPEGIDATMMLLRDYATDVSLRKQIENLVVVAIPVYNVDGCLNRGSYSRANQNGPASYGFRGNAKNLDLNRDFIKCDSKNAQSFNQIFAYWKPDVFMDNHTSNGADYQYTMTLIASQHNKLQADLGTYLHSTFMPSLFKQMQQKGWEMSNYVESIEETPDKGIYAFLESPRFSTGYAALHNIIGFIPETHMLKPFPRRVHSTYDLMVCMLDFLQKNGKEIQTLRQKANAAVKIQKQFPLQWELDTTQYEKVSFKGYEAKYKTSEVSGLSRLYYDRNQPFTKEIPFFNTYKTILSVEAPRFYVIPQAYTSVIERLKWNGVKMQQLSKDSLIQVELYKLTKVKNSQSPYESHFLHRNVSVAPFKQKKLYYKGDYLIPTNQICNRYIVETLEPQGEDSFFAWNFFDGILQQKEYFSDYVFEDLAAEILKKEPQLRAELEKIKAENEQFAKSSFEQLLWVYQHSAYYEPTHNVYPVGRIGTE